MLKIGYTSYLLAREVKDVLGDWNELFPGNSWRPHEYGFYNDIPDITLNSGTKILPEFIYGYARRKLESRYDGVWVGPFYDSLAIVEVNPLECGLEMANRDQCYALAHMSGTKDYVEFLNCYKEGDQVKIRWGVLDIKR